MHPPLRQEILNHSLEIIRLIRPTVEIVTRRDRDLGSQLRRAMSSVSLNLAEAFGSASGHARLRFENARGSLYEVQTGLAVAVAWGFVAPADITDALARIDSLNARIYGLSRR